MSRASLPCAQHGVRRWCALAALSLLLAACAVPGEGGVSAVLEKPAERALLQGLRAYEDANYADAQKELARALALGLASAKDRAMAHKHLAFIHCTSQRPVPCEEAFKQARAADPQFELSKAEAGHPMWGPVYRKVLQAR
jgi:Tfp pilus assembly protein PilF